MTTNLHIGQRWRLAAAHRGGRWLLTVSGGSGGTGLGFADCAAACRWLPLLGGGSAPLWTRRAAPPALPTRPRFDALVAAGILSIASRFASSSRLFT